jgi:nucleotide-binding universal stress UspA family protein
MQNTSKILIAIDMSDHGRSAFYQGISLATRLGIDAHVLYVSEPLRSFDFSKKRYVETRDTIEKVEEGVNRRIDELWAAGGLENVDRRKVHLIIRGGKASQEILDSAAHHQPDLIVLGAGAGNTPLGATAERVVRNATCSVLIVRPQA